MSARQLLRWWSSWSEPRVPRVRLSFVVSLELQADAALEVIARSLTDVGVEVDRAEAGLRLRQGSFADLHVHGAGQLSTGELPKLGSVTASESPAGRSAFTVELVDDARTSWLPRPVRNYYRHSFAEIEGAVRRASPDRPSSWPADVRSGSAVATPRRR